jgi:amino acid adenylation domain-containing protein/non-ribosomal peptide synthase protein (TIGR01720 family)
VTDLELIRQLSALGVKLWVEGEALKFSAPQGTLTGALRERLRARKDDLRLFLQRAGRPRADSEPALARVPRGGPLPLSFGQERLWFLHQLDPADPTYVVPLVTRREGALDAGALERAVQEIVRRHEVLRTTFALDGDRPVAVIHEHVEVCLPSTSFAALPESEREAAVRREIAAELRRPFDLARGPVLRPRLFQLSARDHVLCVTLHHIASDGWTNGILGREIDALYEAFAAGLPSPLPDLPLQYVDHAAWQRRHLAGDVLDEQLAYWKAQLEGAPRTLDLPTDRPRPRVASHQGDLVRFALDARTSRAIDALAKREGATPFMVLLAAFDVLLHRWSGQRDLCVGTPVAGRSRPETEAIAGFFVNTLVLRARLDGAMSFRAHLASVREACLGAYAHQDLPFERLVQELDPARDLSRTPLFQVMFVLQTAPASAKEAPPGLDRRGVAVAGSAAKFDLTLAMGEGPSGFSGAMELTTDLFDRSTVEQMLASFRALLAGIAADPDARLFELPILGDAERHRVLVTWNETTVRHADEALIHEVFAAQAARTPAAVAVSFEGRELTYRQLDANADRLAHMLRAHGVGPETRVGVCMERSLELVVALHGVLKAGGAYVPLDPELPADRRAFMLQDAAPSVVLTQEHLVGLLGDARARASIHVVQIDASAEPTRPPERDGLSLSSLAYVIYTSGSTGRPKGAMNAHGAVLNRLLWMQHAYGLGEADRVLQKTPFGFDVSVWELFWPLMFGARLVMARPGGHREPGYLADTIAAQGITTLHFVPSMLAAFLDELAPLGAAARGLCRSLRRVVCSGEALPPALAARFFAILPGVELCNLYGPTEAAVDVTAGVVSPGAATVTLGRPIHNTRIYLLDDCGQPVPVGARGEICIGGVQVGRGYQNRPDLTAERFVPDPFAGSGARLYRTGDVGRWLPSGEIAYLGRGDLQIKLRGLRIELGEIEATLLAHGAVREAAVVLREDAPGAPRLVAYLVCAPAALAPDAAELRAFLKERLPEPMIPAAFVQVASLPLTASGKVDRRALLAPEAAPESSALAAPEHVAPRGPIEEAIARAFAEVLALAPERVGAHAGFFALGGHSLLATRVVARIRSALGVELPLRALFEAPTPAELAARVDDAPATPGLADAPPVTRAPVGTPRVLSFGQERLWFLDQLDPGDPSYVVPFALRLGGALDAGALERALAEIVRRHEVLRTTYALRDGAPVPVLQAPGLSLPLTDLRALEDAAREAAVRCEIAAEGRRPFDLAAGPVIRARLFALGETEHVLSIAMHHAACDAWSMGVLGRELAALYEAFARGLPSPLPELAIQYTDYAAWQRAWLSGEALERQLAHWREHLAGAPRALDLPLDRPRPPVPSHRGARCALALSPELGDALARLSRELSATLFMVLLAALDVLLHRYTGQDDLVVGAPIAGRARAETEGLIGFFVNTLALRADLSGAPTFTELVARVKEACLGAYAHQDVPFERLVQALDPARDPGRTPLFQVAFALQNAPASAVALPGLQRRALGVESVTAKFDLTLALAEGPRGIAGGFEYAAELFDAATVERMAGHFVALLEAIVAAPSRRIGELDLLGDDERRRLLVAWNATRTEYPREATVHALFAAQAAATPEATAVVFGSERLSYRQLDQRANQLAHTLRARGVGDEVPVGLYARRSLEMVVATLAILKAGGAYVPLDPELPDARLAFLVEDARAAVVVVAGASAVGRPLGRVTLVDLASDAACIAAEPDGAPASLGSGESLACVMYTSGSTGTPKGVCVLHRGVVRLVRGTGYARFGADEVFLQLAPIAFDAATLEVWGPLLNGGTLVVFPDERPTPERIGDVVRAHGVTTLWLTAGLFNAVIEQHSEALRPLRQLLTGGEALSVPHVRRALAELPGVRIVNGYGPTEGTTFTCCHTIVSTEGAVSIPIGRPIANTRVYVLDEHLSPVPIGVPGELCIGGDGLARGYLGRPELTAERFVQDPFDPQARIYRTGDRVRWLADGTLAFLGRLDLQVKLRGFRIELGEIEAVLGEHPAVAECAVILREDAPGDRRLCAYVVGDGAADALRAWLKERLPEPMIPAAFVTLAALPLTPSGKVDRRALPAPERGAGATYVAPRGPIEEALAGIFAEALRLPVEQVGAHDDFFDLGGHSLLATQVVARVRTALGVELPLRALFEAPALADFAARAGAALEAGQGVEAPPLVPTPRRGPSPLSFAQERLWFLHQLDPADPSYVVPLATRFEGALDPAALERALCEVVHRHEVLRTTFALDEGHPAATVQPATSLDLPVTHLLDLPEIEREPALRRALAVESRRPFDLAAGPVLRARLFALGPEDHVLLVTLHHIVADGWTVGVLEREIGALYEAFSQGRSSPLPALPIQYADYATWQRAWLSGAVLDRHLAHGKERLAGAPRALHLPADRPRPAVPTRRGDLRFFTLGADATRALRELARREGATLFMTLLAAFDVLLYRWTGQTDLVVGTPTANRTHAETEGLAGFFVSTLVLRAVLDPELGFRALLRAVREDALGAYAHQDTPFERLVQALEPDRDPGRTPLFQVMFALQTAPAGAAQLGATKRRSVLASSGTAKFDLTLALTDGPRGLSGAMEFSTDLFDAPTVERMLGSFRVLLEGLAEDASLRLWELPILAPDEARSLRARTGGDASFPVSAGLHELFAARARLAPDAVAVTFEGENLTYAALDRRANQVARALAARGVGPEALVGVCLDRSIDMIVALLGTLKAGGAYLPLDPDSPRDRLAFMIEDARVPVVLTHARHAGVIGRGPAVLCLDTDATAIAAQPTTAPACGARPEGLAYVIYTSGSTGKPKGVMIEHRNAVRLFTATAPWFGFDERDVWTLFHSYAFDFSVWEIWGALLHGGRLVIVPYWVSRAPEALHRLLVEEGVTVLNQTPSAFRQLARSDERVDAAARAALALRYVIFGGEALAASDLAPFWDRHGDERPQLVNMYGITETTVHVTYRPLRRADLDRPWSSAIGVPIPDLSVRILDAHRRPVPVGVAGEVYVGGAGVARGYLHRPELSAERFVADPFAERPGERLYRTGDLARHVGAGDIEYLGRIDHQVKIRGHRIELGEIEAALDEHPAVREAVVIAREDGRDGRRLVAYLVGAGALPAPAELRAFLKERLPEPMIPAAFVGIEALPLTVNGKIDRGALASLEAAPASDAATHVPPRGPIEEALASIFAEVLAVPSVGAHDGFFDLGGHSLLATQAVARIRAALGVDLPLRALFEAPSPAELAARVVAAQREGASLNPVAAIPRADRSAPLEPSFGQERLWVLHQLAPDDLSYVVPLTLRIPGPLDAGALEAALREIVRRHEVLRTTFTGAAGRPVPVVHERVDLCVPRDDLRRFPLQEREERAREASIAEARRPFDLARGPVIRARLLVLADDDHLLLLSMHHIVADAWSTRVLFRELDVLYGALRDGRPSPLAELPLQYTDFAAWQRQAFAGEVAERRLAYWKQSLAGAAPAIDLPLDRPRPPVQSHRGARRSFVLPAALAGALDALGRREGTTLFMTLLAALDVLLHRYSGQDDLCVGTPVANRGRAELEGLIGFFLDTLVLRAQLSPELTFREHLARVRATCLGAYAHQDMPFERLVNELDPERDLGRSPLFQVLFTLNEAPASARAPGAAGLAGQAGVGAAAVAKLDLSLGIGRTASGGLAGSFEYATDLFDAATIDRMVEHLHILLEGIARDPGQLVHALPLLSEAERHRVLFAWNDTAFAHPGDAPLQAIFARRAALAPDAVALSFEGHDLTYGELAARAGRVAHALRRYGVRADTRVGVCMERSLDLLVALLGVLGAGGAYVPLDPDHPADRLGFMLDDARPAVILTQAHLASVLPARAPAAPVLRVDADGALLATQPADALDRHALSLSSLAYVIYTSGSTGRPKGAMNAHRGIHNRLLWMQHAHAIGPADRLLQKTPFSFDVSVWELFWPLMFGARLVLARPGGHREPRYLAGTIAAQGVTTLHFVPSMLGVFLDALAVLGAGACPSLRRVFCSGEALPDALAARFFAALPGVELHNLYGPTEAAVEVTACAVLPGRPVTLGRPIHNTRVYVLDGRGQPVPVGVRGELHIGGVQVGRGYLNLPELTAERFVRDPFSTDPAGDGPPARLYRTGDVARWLASGEIEYLGRADFQVKLRGFRIELGEIEVTLLAHPAVREAVVVVRGDPPGLVAYLVCPHDAPAPSVAELRAFLAERLPEPMIPAAFVLLAALPLTASGKVDRRALPAPDESLRPDLGEAYVAPRSGVEEELARIWASVLRRPSVGARDNFFAAGGDSILAIQIVARAQAAGIRLTPRQIFQHPTVAGLASVAAASAAPHAEQGSVTGAVIATPIQRWWLDQRLDGAHHYNQSFFFEVRDRLDAAVLEEAIAAVLQHHDALRLRAAEGPALGIAPPGGPAPLWRIDLEATPEGECSRRIEQIAAEAQASLDLGAGPLLRAVLFDLGPRAPSRLLLVIHHLAVDAVSWRILLEDLWSACAARRAGRPVALPPKTTSFQRWAERLAAHARSAAVDQERVHWLGHARRMAPILPVDHHRGDDTEASARSIVVSLSEADTEALLTRVPEVYRTQINDALLTALAQALGRWTSGEGTPTLTALLALEGHGREELFDDVDLSRTVGWFTTLFPVVLEVRADAAPAEALKAVKEQLRAIPGRGLGYGLLRYLGPDRALAEQLARLPQPELVFNYLGQLDQAVPEAAPLRTAREASGPSHSPTARRSHLLEVTASVRGGRLHAGWVYSENRHRRETVRALAEAWLTALRGLIDACLSAEVGGVTPSDFDKATLSQDAIDMLAALDPEAR